jgi:translocation and assembly module TamA
MLHMRTLIFTCCAVVVLSSAIPAYAAQNLVAPEAVRDLLERHLSLQWSEDELRDDSSREALERRLRREAGELLATEGYFSPQITLRTNESATALQVEPGPRARIGRVQIEIRGQLSAEQREQLIKAWAMPVTTVFQQATWDNAKRKLLRDMSAVDYADARLVSSKAEVDVETARVDLQLVLESGPRYRYGEIRVIGLNRYSQSLVESYCERLRLGKPYRQDDLLATQAALQNTPYFSSVTVDLERSALPAGNNAAEPAAFAGSATSAATEPVQTDEPLQVPVVIQLRERVPYSVTLGAGGSSNTGARVEGSFRDADLFARGWELHTGARIEQLRQSVYADVFFPPDDKQRRDSVGTVVERSDIQGLEIERVAFAGSRLQMRGTIEQRIGFNLQQERQWPNDAPSSTNRALAAIAGWTWHLAVDPLDTSKGIVAQLQLAGATKVVLSDQNFLRTYMRYSQGLALHKSGDLLLRAEVGITAAPSRQGIPQDYLFRAGGANSVRGYDYQSLGVKEGGATVGGRYLVTVSAEYTHWIDSQWGAATFIDAGQAADDRKLLKLVRGYGIGARWKSPAGPLAVDVAWGEFDRNPHLHFSLAIPF